MQLTDQFGPIPIQAILDGSGNGTVQFQPNGKNARITTLFVKVSTATKQANVNIYKGIIADSTIIGNTPSGSTGAPAFGNIDLLDGETLYVVWSGGDAGATASATFVGHTIPFDQVGGSNLRWSDPIAANDGTLVFPAIKSPNYVAGISGWTINRDGSVEFSNGTFRGELDAGGGNVIVKSTGVFVEGSNSLQFGIAVTGGIFARHDPDDGSITQITDQAIFLNSPNPTPINALTLNDGYLSAALDTNGSVETPQIQIKGCSIVGKVTPTFTVWGQSSGSSIDDSFIEVNGRFKQGNLNSWASASSNSGTFSTEAILLSGVAANYLPNSVYQVKVRGRWQPSNTTTPRVVFRLRKTNATGTTLIDWGRQTAISAEPYALSLDGLFQTGSSALTNTTLVLTMASGSGAGVNDILAVAPYYVEILYYDDNSVYTWLGTLT